MADKEKLTRAAFEARARAEAAAEIVRYKNARSKLHKFRDGVFARRTKIGSSSQVVVPAEILTRWAKVWVAESGRQSSTRGAGAAKGLPILVLDLGWAALIVPEEGARVLLADLGVGEADIGTPG
jgi:hypothetical protein